MHATQSQIVGSVAPLLAVLRHFAASRTGVSRETLLEDSACMEGQVTASRVFWPVPCPGADTSGYVIGWNVQGFTTCVAGIIPFGAAPLTAIDAVLCECACSPSESLMPT